MSRVDAVRVVMGPDEIAAVTAVLESGRIVGGPEVAAFEQEFAEVVGGRTCVAVNSGTSALHLGLLASGIGPGDEVVVPSFTFAATANSVAMTGATPVFADIGPDTFCLDPASAEKAVTERTRAIMPVHLYGQTAEWDAFEAVAERHGLLLLEDAAQAHGSTYDGRPAGSLGHVAAFSFYATKNMTTGEGGMVVCADEETARKVRLLRNQGMERRYENEIAGLNNRMTDIAGAIGRVQLRSLAAWNDRRREIAARYSAELQGVTVPFVRPGSDHVFHQYTLRVERRDDVLATLQADGIGADVYYPIPNHQLPAYATDDDLPETARAAREVLSLPIHPRLTDDEVQRVIDSVNQAVARG
ncbi:DegT/DnrJ/EryC1/StrS family aminotransferase [Nocardioides marmoribigeumensis]|uniref:dTDP-4-amino-4,6-dideoxygalactose transaminase n=1 Tax=Nocardioides marmoribigeumensis TaxID=433649 RepID=A0ABU2BQN1_9ACTN|nr:DegT/DnrJ/EryC1/StrS family aminotransferase [Nocardioides marmoribigeumensis]MDR7360566.1 dTDP-4-amino-4,6-dideoxygalactose transaminase [Nocardioides marmoribigeumensis]